MNKIKKLLMFSFVVLFVLPLVRGNAVAASYETTVSDNGKSSWTPTEVVKQNIYGMNYTHAFGLTNATGAVNKQQVNVFSMKTDGVYSKLVNWAYQKGTNGYQRATLDRVASNYEETHPGWIVLAGINGDQYAMESKYAGSNVPFYPQPFYPLIMDGERRFMTGLFGGTGSFVGLKNDGSTNPFVYESSRKGYYIYIVDEKNQVIDEYLVNRLNETPNAEETAVWMPYQKLEYAAQENPYVCPTVNGEHIYVVENAELQYVSNAPLYGKEYAMFGRGEVSLQTTSHTLATSQFVIDTKNAELIAALKTGDRVIVQGAYIDEELNQVESSAGFHAAHRLNNQDVESNASYDTTTYSRSIFGRKADGSYVLATVDMFNGMYKGMTHDEANAMLKSYGVVEAYQQDGGGSVHAIVRNVNGTFDTVNKPKDGGVRANFNGLLFVVRDPGYKIDTPNNGRNSIIIVKKDTPISDMVKNMQITVDGKTYDMAGDRLVIEGLKEDTEYDVTFTYQMLKEGSTTEYVSGSYTLPTKTAAFLMPNSGIVFEQINKTSVKVVKKPNVYASWFQDVVISMGGNEYIMGNENELLIEDLISDTEYDVTITYNVVEEGTGNVYPGSETKTLKTLSYELPTITAFNVVREYSNKIIIKCEYKDPDKKVKKAVLYVNEEEIILKTTSGNQTITDLDFEANEYTFQMVLTYEVGIGRVEKVSSEKIEYKHEGQTKHNITYQLDGGTNEEGAPVEYTEGIGIASLPVPTKEGYRFLGWYKGETKVESISKEETTDITLTAKWESTTMNEPKPKGCKCKKSSMEYIVTLTTTLSLAIFLFRKKK